MEAVILLLDIFFLMQNRNRFLLIFLQYKKTTGYFLFYEEMKNPS